MTPAILHRAHWFGRNSLDKGFFSLSICCTTSISIAINFTQYGHFRIDHDAFCEDCGRGIRDPERFSLNPDFTIYVPKYFSLYTPMIYFILSKKRISPYSWTEQMYGFKWLKIIFLHCRLNILLLLVKCTCSFSWLTIDSNSLLF